MTLTTKDNQSNGYQAEVHRSGVLDMKIVSEECSRDLLVGFLEEMASPWNKSAPRKFKRKASLTTAILFIPLFRHE